MLKKLSFPLIYSVGVFAILLYPVFSLHTKTRHRVDNRLAAPWPKTATPKEFPRKFENWLNDRFGGRKQMVNLWNFMLLECFREAPHPQMIVGSKGQLFFGSHHTSAPTASLIYRALLCPPAEESLRIRTLLRDTEELRRLRLPVYLVAIPTKPMFRLHNLPSYIRRQVVNYAPWQERLLRKLSQEEPQWSTRHLLFPFRAGEELSRQTPLFPDANFHWEPGAYTHLTANLLAKRILSQTPDFEYRREDYTETDVDSDLEPFAYRNLTSRMAITTADGWKRLGIEIKPWTTHYPKLGQLKWHGIYAVNRQQNTGKVLLVGDSFAVGLGRDCARYFSESMTVEYSALLPLGREKADQVVVGILKIYRPDFVVLINHIWFQPPPSLCARLVEYFANSAPQPK